VDAARLLQVKAGPIEDRLEDRFFHVAIEGMRFSTEAVCLVLISDDPAILLIIFLAGAFFV